MQSLQWGGHAATQRVMPSSAWGKNTKPAWQPHPKDMTMGWGGEAKEAEEGVSTDAPLSLLEKWTAQKGQDRQGHGSHGLYLWHVKFEMLERCASVQAEGPIWDSSSTGGI
jgi:hypothetical protein